MLVRAFAVLLALSGGASAADFYEGKSITIVVGFSPGGGYDQLARFAARHMPRFIAGKPNIIVQNLPGAGSLVATTQLFNSAPRNGTVLGVIGGGTVLEPMLGNPQARYDPRQFSWIGGRSPDHFMCALWHEAKVDTIEDARHREVVFGSTGTGSRTMTFPYALNALTGTKFRIVSGYPGGNEISMAMEKREVDGFCGWAISAIRQRAPQWLAEKKLKFLAQFALEKHRDFPDVPLAMDLPESEAGKRAIEFLTADSVLAWPMMTPPGVPQERVDELRGAFEAMMRDPQALADAAKENMEIELVKGETMTKLVHRLYETPAAVIDIVRKINDMR
jgi:tripartite-type tricarboxylate transporter receptor subunit TctC